MPNAMLVTMAVVTFLNLALASYSLWALTTVLRLSKRLRQKLEQPSMRSVSELDAEVSALSASLSSLSTTVRRLSSREGMRDLRARRKEAPNLDLNRMTKAELRRAMNSGQLRAIRDDEPPQQD